MFAVFTRRSTARAAAVAAWEETRRSHVERITAVFTVLTPLTGPALADRLGRDFLDYQEYGMNPAEVDAIEAVVPLVLAADPDTLAKCRALADSGARLDWDAWRLLLSGLPVAVSYR